MSRFITQPHFFSNSASKGYERKGKMVASRAFAGNLRIGGLCFMKKPMEKIWLCARAVPQFV
jgi:hypothetical protein